MTPASSSKQSNRQPLDEPSPSSLPPPVGAPPEKPAAKRAEDPELVAKIDDLLKHVGVDSTTFNAKLVRDLVQTSLKLIPDGRDTGELKLITTAVKEMRYAYRIFGQYPEPHKVSIFGSARTPTGHPDYIAAKEFGTLMAQKGWMIITGAGDGIMKAGHEGPGREASFGVAIRLPFETNANEVIAGDEKLVYFRYFFTRKLMFLSQSEAVALFPGGFGTMDEAFEALTLVQTGKSSMIPIVMVEGKNQTYWEEFDHAMRTMLLTRGWISPEDIDLYRIFKTPALAADHIVQFYRNYHSSRYVKDDLVIRLKAPLKEADVQRLSDEFKILIKQPGATASPSRIVQRGPFEQEDDHLTLPRLSFPHTRYKFGLIRRLIDRINECEPA
ncbi:MAG TPA: LOG family protein [Phycisphaerales bacterium]|jgi:uncharacterized protein (TIGR00730 family)|nr:LOG family protein [Phycisphaerales bacterium]